MRGLDKLNARWMVGLAFTAGVLATAGIMMAVQDWMGLEAYIVYARAHWIELPWVVGVSFAMVGVVAFLIAINRIDKL